MAAIEITRKNLTARELRAAAVKARDAKAARRMLAIALVLEGQGRKTAAEACGMDRQTLRDWVHRYNAEGLAGLNNRTAPGRPSRLTAAISPGRRDRGR
jgi:transposase